MPSASPARWKALRQPRKHRWITTGDVVAGAYTACNVFVDAIAISALVFAPHAALDSHIAVSVQQVLVGFVLTQVVITLASRCARPIIVPPGYEVVPSIIPLISHVVSTVTANVYTSTELLSTVVAGVALVSGLSSLLLAALSWEPERIIKSLPDSVRAGVFAHIGLRLAEIGAQLVASPLPRAERNVAAGPSNLYQLATSASARELALVVPGLVAGVALWLVLRVSSRPLHTVLAVPCALLVVFAHVHASRLAAGLSVQDAQEMRWLLPSTEGVAFATHLSSFDPLAVRWSLLFGPTGLAHVVSAAVVGPLLSTCLNLVLLSKSDTDIFSRPHALRDERTLCAETRAHGLACLSASAVLGAPCYFALSTSAVHSNAGATTWWSSWVAVLVVLVLTFLPASYELIGLTPRAVVTTICAYIGFDFLFESLASKFELSREYVALLATFGTCQLFGTAGGTLLGVGFRMLLVCSAGDEVAQLPVLATPLKRTSPRVGPNSASPPDRARLSSLRKRIP